MSRGRSRLQNGNGHHRLTRQPCPDCNEETLHKAMQCSVCGHINLTPGQQRAKAMQRHIVKVRSGQAPAVNHNEISKHRREFHSSIKDLSDAVYNKLSRDGKL